jgi:glutathione S-transferase
MELIAIHWNTLAFGIWPYAKNDFPFSGLKQKSNMKPFILYSSELSPFALKIQAMCDYVDLPYRLLPETGSFTENLAIMLRKELLVNGISSLTWPKMTALDEFPQVPFLFGPEGQNLYDSSSIAEWLDLKKPGRKTRPLFTPTNDKALAFVIRLIDEYADEFGLYMVHHNRWKVAALDNVAGARLAKEFQSFLWIAQPIFSKWFSERQVRRLPYLFSVAPSDFKIKGLPENLNPPSRKGFPETHSLLEESFNRLLTILETILSKRKYILGERFTLADASIFGQLAINLSDHSAAVHIQDQAPVVYKWLLDIRNHHFDNEVDSLIMDESISPLLVEISRTFIPLMKQNEKAYLHHKDKGETLFNEAAFFKNRSLYSGEIDNKPFKSVVKTFQVKSWRNITHQWSQLSNEDKTRIQDLSKGNLDI